MFHVTFVLIQDNYASTTLSPLEVFHSAGYLLRALKNEPREPLFNVTIASLSGKPVISHHGVTITPHNSIHDIDKTDLILIPSTGLDLNAQISRHSELYPWLRDHYERGAYLASVCTGAAFLAETGLLDGRRATTHWAVAERYAALYPEVHWQLDEMIVEDGRLLTAGGVNASVDMSLYLVEKFCGREIARECARALVLDMPRVHQSGYAILPISKPHADQRIRTIEDYIAQHYSDNLSVESLASQAAMSTRTFIRRFKAATGRLPGNYVQSQRIAVARALLESSASPVHIISCKVGYEDLGFFRKIFKRETGMTPIEYRSKFAGVVH